MCIVQVFEITASKKTNAYKKRKMENEREKNATVYG